MLTTHVVSLELSLALRDAGYPQEGSTFYWSIPMPERAANEKERLILSNQCEVQLCYKWTEWGDKFQNVAAPLASELMEKVDRHFNEWSMGYNDSGCYWKFCFGGRGAGSMIEGCGRTYSVLDLGGEDEYEDTPTNALAKLWLHLNKEGLLK